MNTVSVTCSLPNSQFPVTEYIRVGQCVCVCECVCVNVCVCVSVGHVRTSLRSEAFEIHNRGILFFHHHQSTLVLILSSQPWIMWREDDGFHTVVLGCNKLHRISNTFLFVLLVWGKELLPESGIFLTNLSPAPYFQKSWRPLWKSTPKRWCTGVIQIPCLVRLLGGAFANLRCSARVE